MDVQFGIKCWHQAIFHEMQTGILKVKKKGFLCTQGKCVGYMFL